MKTAIIKYMYVVCISEDTHSISKNFIFAIRVWFWVNPPPGLVKDHTLTFFFWDPSLTVTNEINNITIIMDYINNKNKGDQWD